MMQVDKIRLAILAGSIAAVLLLLLTSSIVSFGPLDEVGGALPL
jgi:hypothetical protein